MGSTAKVQNWHCELHSENSKNQKWWYYSTTHWHLAMCCWVISPFVLWYENWPKIGNKTANINVKTAVYTNVNGDIVSYTSKTAKIKKVILLNNRLTFGDVLQFFYIYMNMRGTEPFHSRASSLPGVNAEPKCKLFIIDHFVIAIVHCAHRQPYSVSHSVRPSAAIMHTLQVSIRK